MVQKLGKNKQLIRLNCLKIDLGTFNFVNLNTIYVEGNINLQHTTDNNSVDALGEYLREWFKVMLNTTPYVERKGIIVIGSNDRPTTQKAKNRSLSFECHMKLKDKMDWKGVVLRFIPIANELKEDIFEYISHSTLKFNDFKGYNSKDYLSDSSVSQTSEPKPCRGCRVQASSNLENITVLEF